MSDRVLRERRTAINDRLAKNETDLRSLRLRARCGAVRTGELVGTVYPPTPTSYNIVTSVTVPSGRWQAFGQCTVALTGATASEEQFVMSLLAYDAVTSEYIDDDAIFDNPSAFAWFSPTTTQAFQTMTTLGDLRYPESATVYLAVANINGSSFAVVEPRLRLLPV